MHGREMFDQTVRELHCRRGVAPWDYELLWMSRGESYSANRRDELRRVAATRITALEKDAKARIEEASVDVQTRLLGGGLESAEARAFLDAMPTADDLMPTFTIAEVEFERPGVRGRLRSIT